MGKADVEAANEIYRVARESADMEIASMKSEIESIRMEAQATALLKKIEYDQAHNEMVKYVVLLRLRDSKSYKKGGMTWADFCEEVVGEPKRTVDQKISEIRPLVERFWAKFAQIAGVPFNKIRYLGKSVGQELAQIDDDGTLAIDDIRIPLTPENKDDIEAAIDSLKDSHKRTIEDRDATIRSKDRVLAEKENVINKQEKIILKYENQAKERGLKPGEGEFLQQVKNAYVRFEGFLIDFDPEYMPEDPTPRMQASYMEALGYFRRMILAAYDTASERYGIPEIDDDWVPPHLRPKEEGGFI